MADPLKITLGDKSTSPASGASARKPPDSVLVFYDGGANAPMNWLTPLQEKHVYVATDGVTWVHYTTDLRGKLTVDDADKDKARQLSPGAKAQLCWDMAAVNPTALSNDNVVLRQFTWPDKSVDYYFAVPKKPFAITIEKLTVKFPTDPGFSADLDGNVVKETTTQIERPQGVTNFTRGKLQPKERLGDLKVEASVLDQIRRDAPNLVPVTVKSLHIDGYPKPPEGYNLPGGEASLPRDVLLVPDIRLLRAAILEFVTLHVGSELDADAHDYVQRAYDEITVEFAAGEEDFLAQRCEELNFDKNATGMSFYGTAPVTSPGFKDELYEDWIWTDQGIPQPTNWKEAKSADWNPKDKDKPVRAWNPRAPRSVDPKDLVPTNAALRILEGTLHVIGDSVASKVVNKILERNEQPDLLKKLHGIVAPRIWSAVLFYQWSRFFEEKFWPRPDKPDNDKFEQIEYDYDTALAKAEARRMLGADSGRPELMLGAEEAAETAARHVFTSMCRVAEQVRLVFEQARTAWQGLQLASRDGDGPIRQPEMDELKGALRLTRKAAYAAGRMSTWGQRRDKLWNMFARSVQEMDGQLQSVAKELKLESQRKIISTWMGGASSYADLAAKLGREVLYEWQDLRMKINDCAAMAEKAFSEAESAFKSGKPPAALKSRLENLGALAQEVWDKADSVAGLEAVNIGSESGFTDYANAVRYVFYLLHFDLDAAKKMTHFRIGRL